MRKNKNILILVIIIILLTLFTLIISADNASNFKAIAANIANCTFKYKGKEIELVNRSNKRKLQPINYNNDLYVPIQSIADLLNVPVRYDDENKAVEIGQKDSRGVSLLDLPETSSNDVRYFLKTIDEETLTLNKESFDFGLALIKPRKKTTYSRIFTLDKQYERINFSSIISSATKSDNTVLKFVDVDRKIVLSIIDVGVDKTAQNYSVKVLGVNKLQIIIEVGDRNIAKYIMGDIYLK